MCAVQTRKCLARVKRAICKIRVAKSPNRTSIIVTRMTIRLLIPGEGERAAELARRATGAADWPAAEYERLAASPSDSSFCLVVEDPAGEIAGLLVATAAAGEAEIQNVAVSAEKRRGGLASALLAVSLQRLAALGAQTVWLEVRESNHAAIAFYERHGFRRAGRRPAYYSSPAEAALILSRTTEPRP